MANEIELTDGEALKRKQLEAAARERLRELAAVLETPEGRMAIARILMDLGVGRQIFPEELDLRNCGLRLLEHVKKAGAGKAEEILKIIFGLAR